jgi:hypothetical protein
MLEQVDAHPKMVTKIALSRGGVEDSTTSRARGRVTHTHFKIYITNIVSL